MTAPPVTLELPTELEEYRDDIAETIREVRDKLEQGTLHYRSQINKVHNQNRPSHNGDDRVARIAEPTAVFSGLPYQFFDLIAVGPFQPIGTGPFRPNRIVRAGEPAYLLAAVWRNPVPLGFTPGNPSAAEVMAGQRFTIRGQTVNINDVTAGPDLGPATGQFGGGFVDFRVFSIPSMPAPEDGSPRLLDITLTIDVNSVESGLPPFAGYASLWLQLDTEPPFVFPYIPGVNGGPIVVPGLVPSFVRDIPVRVLIYS